MAEKKTKKKTKKKTTKKAQYTAKDIAILKGLEPIRKRPGMYIGSTGLKGLHHLVKEVVGNSVDEAIMGRCTLIEVELLPDNKIAIADNGRGIPVDKHPETGKSALETILTYLHSGAKFGGKAYATSGGLHGVGLAAVSALSEWLKAEIKRDGHLFQQEYSRGKPKGRLKKVGKARGTGTRIVFRPDPEIFPEIEWKWDWVLKMLRQEAFLTPGVQIVLRDLRQKGEEKEYFFYFEGGIASYVKYLTRGREIRHPNVFYIKDKKEDVVVEVALRYTNELEAMEESFVNNVYTREGGSHISGFHSALTRSLNEYAEEKGLIKKKSERLSGRDTRQGLTAVISVKVREPQFEGQTKKKLGNPEVRGIVHSVVSEALTDFLKQNPQDARIIVENCITAKRAWHAAQKARNTIFKKGISRFLALPGKLADCSSRNPEERELYLVEGPSAGGSAKQGRDRRFQAILALRGKVLNAEKARLDKVLQSEELKSIIITLGTSIGEEFDIEKLRYHRIIIMADADVDGMHIRTLLLTFFFRYFRALIENGYVYIAQPPIYQIKKGKNVEYVYSEDDKDKVIKKMGGEMAATVQRYKGLGEMNPEQLWETTMNPDKRILLQVNIEDGEKADKIFDQLMGTEVPSRKRFIQVHARQVENIDI